MAKNMARIENGIVINVEWCSDRMAETDTLKNVEDRSVGIGDTYENGKFYRNGEEVLTPLEEALKKNAEYEAAIAESVPLSDLTAAYQEGVNAAYDQ